MKLSELIKKYGDDDVIMQTLDSDIIELSAKKSHYEIKFGTSMPFHVDRTQKIGLVVWLDRDKVDEILKANKSRRGKEDAGVLDE